MRESGRDEADLARVVAERRTIEATWLIIIGVIALGAIAPVIESRLAGRHAEPTQNVVQNIPRMGLAEASLARWSHVSRLLRGRDAGDQGREIAKRDFENSGT